MEKEAIVTKFKQIQDNICEALEFEDGSGKFIEDLWYPNSGGVGRTRIINNGKVIEKGGVNFTEIKGVLTQDTLKKVLHIDIDNPAADFFATGISIVIHPINPLVPIIHMNVRYFEMSDGSWWFGGGIDLTPHYVDLADAKYFHQQLKQICDKHNPDYYSKFKTWADNYFYLSHRNETRGIGGIFFDRLNDQNYASKEALFSFVTDLATAFIPIYIYLMHKNKLLPYTEEQQQWQYIRRGRYVEFNLLYDRGTRFGLDTGGRVESILMSLPKIANWVYNYTPQENSAEYQTLRFLKKDIDWLGF